MKTGDILYMLILIVWIILILRDTITKRIVVISKSKRLSWLRKRYYNRFVQEFIGYIDDYKVGIYIHQYLATSVAIKNYYIKNGYSETRYILIGKVEEIERFVREFKFNTFNNLSTEEEEYIDRYIFQMKNDTRLKKGGKK